MFPTFETEHIILKPFEESDYERAFELINAFKAQNPENPYGRIKSLEDAKKISQETARAENEFLLLDKKTKTPIGWAVCDKAMGFKIQKRTYLTHWLRDEYRHLGLGHEILIQLMSFAFFGVGTENVVTNVKNSDQKSLDLMRKLGFEQYSYFPKNKEIDENTVLQFKIPRATYLEQDYVIQKEYNYELPKELTSIYSYENPIRKIDGITFIKQPTGYLCGQSVIAMLAGVSVDEVIEVMRNRYGTSTTELRHALDYYGIKMVTKKRQPYEGKPLPKCCILSISLPGYGHWSLYYDGKYYDPEFGVLDELTPNEKLRFYWEVAL